MDDRSRSMPGSLLLLGGEEGGTAIDEDLVATAGGDVLVLPTGAAYERPERALARAQRRFGELGGRVRPCAVLTRADAEDRANADLVAAARFLYLCGGSPLHLRSVLKDSQVLQAVLSAWANGAVVVGAGGGATVLSDPMVDPRGGAFTVGLGLVRDLAVTLEGAEEGSTQKSRTLALAPSSCTLVALGPESGLVREPDGTWRRGGTGTLEVFADGAPVGLERLAGKSLHSAVSR